MRRSILNASNRVLSNLFVGILAFWLCAVASMKIYGFVQERRAAGRLAVKNFPAWRDAIASREPQLGRKGAPFVILEFSDYECPFCRLLEPQLDTFVERHKNDVALYRFDYPIESLHPFALSAAIAANCAELQGRATSFEAALFRARLDAIIWEAEAKQAGIPDLKAFQTCVERQATINKINADRALGKRLDIRGTPTLIANGKVISGPLTAAHLEALFEAETGTSHADGWRFLTLARPHLLPNKGLGL